MIPNVDSDVISHAIQLAIAPVFLLTGVAGLLGVMANRLARVIDRARSFEEKWDSLDEATRASVRQESEHLLKRFHWASWAINFCAAAALIVCLVIVTLFVEEFFGRGIRSLAGLLFVVAMVSLIGGLGCFLREVYLATHTVHIEPHRFG
jgi:hypothetical protein